LGWYFLQIHLLVHVRLILNKAFIAVRTEIGVITLLVV